MALQRIFGNRVVQRAIGPESARPADSGQTRQEAGALPAPLRARFEAAFDADLSSVRVHTGARASSIGAQAFTEGEDLHFAPGQFRPETPAGRRLIGHELAHVLQQRAGRVRADRRHGPPVNTNPALEGEADRLGARAAAGQRAAMPGGIAAPGPTAGSAPAPIQGVFVYDEAFEVWLDAVDMGGPSTGLNRYRDGERIFVATGANRICAVTDTLQPVVRQIKQEKAEGPGPPGYGPVNPDKMSFHEEIARETTALTEKARKKKVFYTGSATSGVKRIAKDKIKQDELGTDEHAGTVSTVEVPLLFNKTLSEKSNNTRQGTQKKRFVGERIIWQANCVTLADTLRFELSRQGRKNAKTTWVLPEDQTAIVPVATFADPNLRGNLFDETGALVDMHFVFTGHNVAEVDGVFYDPTTGSVYSADGFAEMTQNLVPAADDDPHLYTIANGFEHNGKNYTQVRRMLDHAGEVIVSDNVLTQWQLVAP